MAKHRSHRIEFKSEVAQEFFCRRNVASLPIRSADLMRLFPRRVNSWERRISIASRADSLCFGPVIAGLSQVCFVRAGVMVLFEVMAS